MNGIQVSLTPRDRRALIAGATAIGLLLVVGRAGPAWRRWEAAARARADQATQSLAREAAVLRARRSLHDSLTARRQRLSLLAPAWLDGDSPTAGGAALAALVSSAATHAEMTVGALDIRADTMARGPIILVRVHASATGDIHGVATLLAMLERGPTRVVVRALTVQSSDPAATPDRPEILHAELVVEGAWRRPAKVRRP